MDKADRQKERGVGERQLPGEDLSGGTGPTTKHALRPLQASAEIRVAAMATKP